MRWGKSLLVFLVGGFLGFSLLALSPSHSAGPSAAASAAAFLVTVLALGLTYMRWYPKAWARSYELTVEAILAALEQDRLRHTIGGLPTAELAPPRARPPQFGRPWSLSWKGPGLFLLGVIVGFNVNVFASVRYTPATTAAIVDTLVLGAPLLFVALCLLIMFRWWYPRVWHRSYDLTIRATLDALDQDRRQAAHR